MTTNKRGVWSTRFGFYLAAIGSACGLGNLWRFPHVVGENGGGAFVLLYIFIALVIGLPLMIGELILGKSTQKSLVAAINSLSFGPRSTLIFQWLGRISVIISLVVLSYYAVISGWVLHFLFQFLVAGLGNPLVIETHSMSYLMSNASLQIVLASLHILFCVMVVINGVQQGLEKWIGYVMPIFTVLLFVLLFQSLSLETASQALRFLFYPDFSKLTLSSLIHALGHVFFTLSVGFGTMVTFGSYMKETSHIPTAGFRVTLVETFLSLTAGMILFPFALSASANPLTGTGMMFQALPHFLGKTEGGVIFGLIFFAFLYIASLGASIGLLEVIVSNWVDRLRWRRQTATWVSAGLALVLALIPALFVESREGSYFWGRSFIEILDEILINWFLPLITLGISLAITFGLSKKEKERLFVNSEKIESISLFSHWLIVSRWLAPLVIIIAFALQLIHIFTRA